MKYVLVVVDPSRKVVFPAIQSIEYALGYFRPALARAQRNIAGMTGMINGLLHVRRGEK
jgi:hypothetical protein